MPFNIESFRSNISGWGYLPQNKYEVYINPPPILRNTVSATNVVGLVKYRAKNFKAPGIEILNIDALRYGVGTSQKMPTSAKYEEISFAVLLDQNAELWDFWHKWTRTVFEYSPTDSQSYRFANYSAEYKQNYATTMKLIVYDHFGNITTEFNFYDAYPISVKDIALDWDEQSKLASLDISLTFKEYTMNISKPPLQTLK